MRRPQQDVPNEVIIHNIVKDYQRMYNGFHAMRESKDAHIGELLKKISKKSITISNLQAENKQLRKQLEEVRASRNAVAKAVSEDIEEQLAEANKRLEAANRKNNLLIQALQDPNIVYEVNSHTLTDGDDKEWMDKAKKQLEKAMLNFTAIEARLAECETALKGVTETVEGTRAISKINKAFTKIDSCVSHIEDFFVKVGNIKIDE